MRVDLRSLECRLAEHAGSRMAQNDYVRLVRVLADAATAGDTEADRESLIGLVRTLVPESHLRAAVIASLTPVKETEERPTRRPRFDRRAFDALLDEVVSDESLRRLAAAALEPLLTAAETGDFRLAQANSLPVEDLAGAIGEVCGQTPSGFAAFSLRSAQAGDAEVWRTVAWQQGLCAALAEVHGEDLDRLRDGRDRLWEAFGRQLRDAFLDLIGNELGLVRLWNAAWGSVWTAVTGLVLFASAGDRTRAAKFAGLVSLMPQACPLARAAGPDGIWCVLTA